MGLHVYKEGFYEESRLTNVSVPFTDRTRTYFDISSPTTETVEDVKVIGYGVHRYRKSDVKGQAPRITW